MSILSLPIVPPLAKTCRHCGRDKVNRPRGLCWTCYYTPGVRDRYLSTSKFARRGVRDRCGRVPLPCAPTAALPCTPSKVAVMAARAARGESIFHPLDAQLPEACSVRLRRKRRRKLRYSPKYSPVRQPRVYHVGA